MKSCKKTYKLIKDSRAFTLAEALVAILIMLMVTSIVAAGIPSARNAYERVVKVSNAELLLSTTASALRNELTTAGHVEIIDDSITYYNNDTGIVTRIYKYADGADAASGWEVGEMLCQRNDSYALSDLGLTLNKDNKDNQAPSTIVIDAATDEDLYVTYEGVEYIDGVVTFSDLQVKRRSNTSANALTAISSFSVRVIESN